MPASNRWGCCKIRRAKKGNRVSRIRSMLGALAIAAALAVDASGAQAASSFTSVAQSVPDPGGHRFGPFLAYDGGKLISEDDRNFTLDAFGCRFSVQGAPNAWPD